MTVQDLGAVGELFGSVFVLVTLIYIAIQTRQSRVTVAAQSARELTTGFSNSFNDLKDAELALLVRRAINDWNSLTANEQVQVHTIFLNMLVHYTAVIEQEHLPGIEDIIPAYENNVLGLITSEGGAVWWEHLETSFPSKIVSRLNSRLLESDSLPPAWNEIMPWYRYEDESRGT
jgi:hypothetical protein